MAHSKILYNNYSEESGVSTVTRTSKYGLATGVAICNEEDKDVQSGFTGGYIADCRALIEIQQRRAADFWSRYYGAVEMANALPYEDYYIERQCRKFKKRAEQESNKTKRMKENLKKYCDEIGDAKREFRKKHESNA